MVEYAALAALIFFRIYFWIVFVDVLMSWTSLFGLHIRIPFVRRLVDPPTNFIRARLPTTFSGLDFSPLILMFATQFAASTIVAFFPSVNLL